MDFIRGEKTSYFLGTLILKYDFGPVKLLGLSRNMPLDSTLESKLLPVGSLLVRLIQFSLYRSSALFSFSSSHNRSFAMNKSEVFGWNYFSFGHTYTSKCVTIENSFIGCIFSSQAHFNIYKNSKQKSPLKIAFQLNFTCNYNQMYNLPCH